MALTIEELKSRLVGEYDEVTLLEILNVTAEDLVEAFEDRVIDRVDKLMEAFEDGEETIES